MSKFVLETKNQFGIKGVKEFTDGEEALKKFYSGFYKEAKLTRELDGIIYTIAYRH